MDADTTIETAERLIKHGTYGRVTPDGLMAIFEHGEQIHVVARCDACRWWLCEGDECMGQPSGYCRRRSPVVRPYDGTRTHLGRDWAVWPETRSVDSCGDFTHKGGEA